MAYRSFGVDQMWSLGAVDTAEDLVRRTDRRPPPRACRFAAAGREWPALPFDPNGADEVAVDRLRARSGGAGGKVRYDPHRGWMNSAVRRGEHQPIVP